MFMCYILLILVLVFLPMHAEDESQEIFIRYSMKMLSSRLNSGPVIFHHFRQPHFYIVKRHIGGGLHVMVHSIVHSQD